jgi:hypothetical protein
LQQVVKEIGGSNFVLFIDDFHYIPKDVQSEIGKQIKAAAEAGVRLCTASVPHRKDDVVRSNPELRGRVTGIDSDYWNETELAQIAHTGFAELNMDVSPNIIQRFAREAFGSPQLMQAICLNACFEQQVDETLPELRRFDPDFVDLERIFERTSTLTNFSSMIEQLHKGPRQRGVERKEYGFKDGTTGDVYRCVLLAMKTDPPRLSFKYEDMLRRVESVCSGDQPSGSSVNQALEQMTNIARMVQEAPVLEWDEDVLDIIEPYFLSTSEARPTFGLWRSMQRDPANRAEARYASKEKGFTSVFPRRRDGGCAERTARSVFHCFSFLLLRGLEPRPSVYKTILDLCLLCHARTAI